ncbi:hypothetical protein MMC19_004241 [Ptychographa xylographoides]|nr:hypothetical protein [Ptychographa xylographoides]
MDYTTAKESKKTYATTVLVNNIHCASCVTHIETVLQALPVHISKINVSVVSQEVYVQHDLPTDASVICDALSEAAFEVHSFSTLDEAGAVVSQRSFPNESNGWLNGASHIWRSPLPKAKGARKDQVRRNRGISRKHLDNCVACREGKQSVETPDQTSQDPPDSYILTLSIGGMTCASCTSAIKNALQNLDYVKSADVDLITNSARVQFVGDKGSETSIADAIEDVGYEVSIASCEPSKNNHKAQPDVKAVQLYKSSLSIAGMTCVACPNAITRGLWELPFIKNVNITLMTGGGEVTYEGKENLKSILEKIDDVGYDCAVVSSGLEENSGLLDRGTSVLTTRTVQLKVEGMFCQNCPKRIIETLESKFESRIEIVKAPTLKDPIVTVTYRPRIPDLTIRHIVIAINSINEEFTATVYHPPSMEDRSRIMQIHERNRMLKRLLLSFIVAIPTLLIAVVWMSLVPESNSVRRFFETPVWSGDVTRAEWALFILATPVMFFAADVFHVRALKEIRALWRRGSKVPILERFTRFGSMNLLISAGTSVAYIASLALLITGATSTSGTTDTSTYFDSVVFLTFFILIGRNLEAYSKSKTGDAVAMLGQLRPEEATLVLPSAESSVQSPLPENEKKITITQPTRTERISADLLEVGDLVIVPHGSSPPADGIITSGSGQFDESSLTGESRPVRKGPGEIVFVGTVNTGDPLTIQVAEIGGTSMLDQIVSVVREGQTKRAPVERLADVLTGYFVPVITGLAIITFFIWFALGQSGTLNPNYLGGQAGGWGFWSLEFAIAVFVVACPCGIGLAAPTALFVGGGLAAKHGILVRGGGEAFQEAGDLDAIVFDKTGTLTEGGSLRVTDHEILWKDPEKVERIWSIVRTLEEQSSHPIAKAILALASTQPSTTVTVKSVTEEPGRGVRGTFEFVSVTSSISEVYEVALGSETFISSLQSSAAKDPLLKIDVTSELLHQWKSQAKSVAVLALRSPDVDGAWHMAALFATSDPIRPSALPTIQTLQNRNIEVYMLSGDNPITALAVASSLGIPEKNVFAGVLPAEKAEKIRWLQMRGSERTIEGSFISKLLSRLGIGTLSTKERRAKIGFVGDGINDTPALAAADVSISPSSGSPIALSSSSFILLTSSLLTIPLLLDLSGRVFRRIKFNFGWALGYNVLLVPVAAGVLFAVGGGGWRLGPVWASAAMAASSVSVVLSSLALRWEGGWVFWRQGRSEKRSKGGEVRSAEG